MKERIILLVIVKRAITGQATEKMLWGYHWYSGMYVVCAFFRADPETQLKRIQNRFAETPDQTWPMSEEELTKWRAFFSKNEPDEAELNDTILEDAPAGYASWSAWAAWRWPSLPDEYA